MPITMMATLAALIAGQNVSVPTEADARQMRNAVMVQRHYPAESLARGEEGVVGFQVVVEPTGRIRSCKVTRSSGFAALDTTTCDLMIENARFKAVADARGHRGLSRHDGMLAWTLPADVARPAVAAIPVASTRTDEIICRRQLKPDSNYLVTKLCLSPAEWHRTFTYGRMQTSWYQGNGMVP